VQQHAERSPDVAEDLDDGIDDPMMLGRHVGLAGDGGDPGHDRELPSPG
jgi:hypothetical protein